MALIYGSSKTNPNYANFTGGLFPQSSQTNSAAANYQGRQTTLSGAGLPNVQVNSTPPGVLGLSTGSGVGSSSNNTGPQQDVAEAMRQAELASLNTEYDRNMADLDAQVGQATSQKDLALQGITNAQNQLLSDVGTQKQSVQTQGETAVDTAASTARDTQRLNRNVLRSLGILNSTYAADKLQEPNNMFQKAKADIGTQVTQRMGELDNFMNQKKSEFVTQIQSINSQFAQMVDNINRDLRFTDRQRADAIKQVNAAYNSKLLDLKTQTKSIVDSVEQAKQNFLASNFSNIITANPDLLSNLDTLNTYKTNLSTLGSGIYGQPQQVSTYEDQKKKQLLGSSFLSSSGGY